MFQRRLMCSFSHDPRVPGNSGKGQRQKGRSSSPASIRRQNRLTARDKNPQKDQVNEREALWTRVKFHAYSNLQKIRHESSGILPYV